MNKSQPFTHLPVVPLISNYAPPRRAFSSTSSVVQLWPMLDPDPASVNDDKARLIPMLKQPCDVIRKVMCPWLRYFLIVVGKLFSIDVDHLEVFRWDLTPGHFSEIPSRCSYRKSISRGDRACVRSTARNRYQFRKRLRQCVHSVYCSCTLQKHCVRCLS